MNIEITQNDIDNGVQSKTDACAIARAIKRVMGEKTFVVVRHDCIYIDGYVVGIPEIATNFIKKFDDNKSIVSPFSFMLGDFQPRQAYDELHPQPKFAHVDFKAYHYPPKEYVYIKKNWASMSPLDLEIPTFTV